MENVLVRMGKWFSKIACNLAQNTTKRYMDANLCNPDNECGGRAVELTNLSNNWLNLFGDWNLSSFIKKRN